MKDRIASRLKFARWWSYVPGFFWALVMVGLPLTSFPLITRFTGSTVAPFSAIPLAFVAFVWFFPYLMRKGSLPKESIPFVFFILWTVFLAALAFFNITGMFRDKSLLGQTVRTFIPFIIGMAFFFIPAAWIKDTAKLRRSLQWINAGAVVMLMYAVGQVLVVTFFNDNYPPFMQWVLSALVTQSNMAGTGRIAGLTWEASWFAHQLNMLYFPLWLAASYRRTTVFPRIWKISVENIFLVVGIVVFFFTSPRIGGAALMLMLFYLFLKFNLAIYRWVIHRLSNLWAVVRRSRLIRVGVAALVVVLFIGVYGVFSWGVLKVASDHDWRVGLLVNNALSQSDLQGLSRLDEGSLFMVSQRFAFLERTVYWMTGWHIFNDYPVGGVGLGNSGYVYLDHMPAIGWATYEIRTMAYRNDGLPNIKSFWYRLLAETGIVGTVLFVVWLLVLWSALTAGQRSKDKTLSTTALAGQLSLLAFVFEGFSIDSFGLPYLFLMAGFAAAIGAICRRMKRQAILAGDSQG